MAVLGPSPTSQDVRLESAKWGKAVIDQITVANCDFVSKRPRVAPLLPSRTHIDARVSNPFLKTRFENIGHFFAVIARSFCKSFELLILSRCLHERGRRSLRAVPPCRHPHPRPPHPDSGQATPHARNLSQELRN